MRRRMILTVTGLVVFLTAIGLIKFHQIQVAIAQGAAWSPPPEAVTTIVARAEDWPATLSAIGTADATQGVTLSADLPGIVETIAFESGQKAQAGAVLVHLDTRQEEAQLAAADAARELARLELARVQTLRAKGVSSQAELDGALAADKQAEARAAEIRATIERKTVRAPFAGVLGIRKVNLGQYLTSGDEVVTLQSLDPIYVNFTVPQQDAARMAVGAEVRATVEEMAGALTGRVTAVDAVVDPATRNLQVQATFRNPDGRLRPGMFVDAEVILGASSRVITLPASAVSYAPYGNSVFILEDMKTPGGATYRGVRQQFVKLGSARGDQVAVLSGVEPGAEVVTSGVFKLRTGAAVLVNNAIQPGNDPAPRPEEG